MHFHWQLNVYDTRSHKNVSPKREPILENVFKIYKERDPIFIYFLCKLSIENAVRFNNFKQFPELPLFVFSRSFLFYKDFSYFIVTKFKYIQIAPLNKFNG